MRQTSARRRADHSRPGGAQPYRGVPNQKAPPELTDDKVRCPVCRNAVKPTTTGFLRSHRDLFGHQCYNRRPPEERSDD